jgi:hypothetical protein
MKRLLTLALLTLTLLTVACSTATMSAPKGAADLSGMVSAVDGNTITVTPAGGQPTTVTLGRDTAISWPGGAPALVTEISKGHMVNVWLAAGSQNATRVNIGH